MPGPEASYPCRTQIAAAVSITLSHVLARQRLPSHAILLGPQPAALLAATLMRHPQGTACRPTMPPLPFQPVPARSPLPTTCRRLSRHVRSHTRAFASPRAAHAVPLGITKHVSASCACGALWGFVVLGITFWLLRQIAWHNLLTFSLFRDRMCGSMGGNGA